MRNWQGNERIVELSDSVTYGLRIPDLYGSALLSILRDSVAIDSLLVSFRQEPFHHRHCIGLHLWQVHIFDLSQLEDIAGL